MRAGIPNYPKLSPVEARMMKIWDRFDFIFSNRGTAAAEQFVTVLEGNAPVRKHVYQVEHGRLYTPPPAGGAVAAAQAAYDAADARWQALRAQLTTAAAELAPLRARLAELVDPDSFDDASEAQELGLRISIIERRCAKLSAAMDEGGEHHHLKIERDSAFANLQGARSIEGRARAQLAELDKQIGPVLANLHYATGDLDDLSRVYEVKL